MPSAWVHAVFFFSSRRRHTIFDCDWGSDVCSSDLRELLAELEPRSAFRVSRLDEFLQLAGEGAKPAPLDGELRWSYRYAWTLQGVHATRAPLKRRATAAELSLARLAQPRVALAAPP